MPLFLGIEYRYRYRLKSSIIIGYRVPYRFSWYRKIISVSVFPVSEKCRYRPTLISTGWVIITVLTVISSAIATAKPAKPSLGAPTISSLVCVRIICRVATVTIVRVATRDATAECLEKGC